MKCTYFLIDEKIHIDRLYSFFLFSNMPTDFSFPGESHDFWECMYIVDGTICAIGNERVYNLEPGHIIFHKPNELHKFYNTSSPGANALIFSFSMHGELCAFFKDKVFKLNPKQQQIINNMVEYASEHSPVLSGSLNMHNRFTEPIKRIPTYLQMISTYVHQLFLSIAENSTLSTAHYSPSADIFNTAVRFMHKNINTPLSVSDIAAESGTSVSNLKRIFDKYAGMPIHRYFLTLRLNRAAILLKQGHSVKETADLLGFSSQCYFSSVYKREMKLPPSQTVRRFRS